VERRKIAAHHRVNSFLPVDGIQPGDMSKHFAARRHYFLIEGVQWVDKTRPHGFTDVLNRKSALDAHLQWRSGSEDELYGLRTGWDGYQ